jgi:hypothetical protein
MSVQTHASFVNACLSVSANEQGASVMQTIEPPTHPHHQTPALGSCIPHLLSLTFTPAFPLFLTQGAMASASRSPQGHWQRRRTSSPKCLPSNPPTWWSSSHRDGTECPREGCVSEPITRLQTPSTACCGNASVTASARSMAGSQWWDGRLVVTLMVRRARWGQWWHPSLCHCGELDSGTCT